MAFFVYHQFYTHNTGYQAKYSLFKLNRLWPQYYIVFDKNISVAKKRNPSSQSRHLALSVTRDHITSKHPVEHLGHKVNPCLVHSDLKSLAANDYLCWTRRAQLCHKLSWLVLVISLHSSSKFRNRVNPPSTASLAGSCLAHLCLLGAGHIDLEEWPSGNHSSSPVVFTTRGQIKQYMRKRRVALLLLIFNSMIQRKYIEE